MTSFLVDDYVTKKDGSEQIGIIEAIDRNTHVITVRWGVDDRKKYVEDLLEDQLEQVFEKIYSPDEVIMRQIDEKKTF